MAYVFFSSIFILGITILVFLSTVIRKTNYKTALVYSIVSLIYEILFWACLNILTTDITVMLYALFLFISFILSLILLIISAINIRSNKIGDKKIKVLIYLALVFLSLFMWLPIAKDLYLIEHSDFVIGLNYQNNGGMFESSEITVVVDSKGCHNINISSYMNLRGNLKHIESTFDYIDDESKEYLINGTKYSIKSISDEEFFYKNNKKVCKINNMGYGNLSSVSIYMNTKDDK